MLSECPACWKKSVRLARLEANPIEHLPVKLDKIIQQVVEMIQATPEAAGRKLTIDLPPGPFPLPPVLGDDDLLFIARA